MKKYIIVAVTIMSLLATFATGCLNTTNGKSPDEGTGTLKLNLSGAPIDADNVAGVYVTINEIQYNLDGEWITAEEFDGPQSYNLLELTGGNFLSLGEFELSAGYYVQIRFILDIQEYGSTSIDPSCYIEFTDGSEKPLYIPSGGETGFKVIGLFEVQVNGTAEVTADFDVRKAVVEVDQSGIYILKPTIRLVVNDQAGNISSSIANDSSYKDIMIYAYEDGTWTGNEDDEPTGKECRFPDTVTSGKMDEEGNYILALLAAGTYDLVVAGSNGDNFGEVLGFISDVKVKTEQTTSQEIEIPFPSAPSHIAAIEGNKGILLGWTDNNESDLDGYNVYCGTESGGPYIKIAEVTTGQYHDNGLTNGIAYYYVVTAFDDSNNESVYSKEVPATPHE